MSVEVSGISITEPHLASNESRDEIGNSYIMVGGSKLHLWQIDINSDGTTRTYRDKESELRKKWLWASGRFTLVAEDNAYVTSWDTWEQAGAAWPKDGRLPAPYRLVDNETGRVWHSGSRHEWEDAQT